MLRKFGLLKSCQPIKGQLIDKTGSNFPHLSVTITISPSDLSTRFSYLFLEIQNGCQGAPKWPTGSGKGSNPRLLFRVTFANKFFDPSTPSMRKGRKGEKNGKEKKGENSGH